MSTSLSFISKFKRPHLPLAGFLGRRPPHRFLASLRQPQHRGVFSGRLVSIFLKRYSVYYSFSPLSVSALAQHPRQLEGYFIPPQHRQFQFRPLRRQKQFLRSSLLLSKIRRNSWSFLMLGVATLHRDPKWCLRHSMLIMGATGMVGERHMLHHPQRCFVIGLLQGQRRKFVLVDTPLQNTPR